MGNRIENYGLVGGFNTRNKNNVKLDKVTRGFQFSNHEKKLFDKDPDEYIEQIKGEVDFLNLNKKIEIFCNDYQLETLSIYLSKEKCGVLIVEMESKKLNSIIVAIFLMFMTYHFGFKFDQIQEGEK